MSKPHANPAENEFETRTSTGLGQQGDDHSTKNQREEDESGKFRPVSGTPDLPQIPISPIVPRWLFAGDGAVVITRASGEAICLAGWVVALVGADGWSDDIPPKRWEDH